MTGRWRGSPKEIRVAAAVFVGVLAYGTAVHVVHLVGSGFDPYPELPVWLRTYFVALTILDPLAAVLLAWCTRTGVVLAAAVLVSNAFANGWANYALDTSVGITEGRFGHAVITLLALGICAFGPQLWRAAALPCQRPR